MRKKIYFLLVIVGAIVPIVIVFSWPPAYTYQERPLPATFDEYYRQQSDSSIAHHARPGNEEKLIRHNAGKSHLAILYIHGFGASRGEGEYVMDSIANLFSANVYYLRLPGHGTNYEEQAATSFRDYLDDAIASLKMMHLLGDKVIVVGTSMGGLIATYLAANYPELVDGLILCSPFYDYASPAAKAIKIPGMLQVVKLFTGPLRTYGNDPEFKKMAVPGYNDHWYVTHKYDALLSLENLRKFAACNATYTKVQAPTLLLRFYRDKDHHDNAASVDAMQNAFDHFDNNNPATKKMVDVANGNHVLTSYYVHSDKAFVIGQMSEFLKQF